MTTQADHIIAKFRTQQRLAEAVGTTQSAVAAWKKRGFIPVRQQEKVLKAAKEIGVDLSPSDFFQVEEAA